MSTGRSPFCRFLLPTLAVAAAAGGSASPAVADIVGAGPDETIQQAYGPLAPTVNYSGAFTDANDDDYLAFRVASAGETLRFTVSNTLQTCNSPDDDSCPLYATLMDQTNSQVGADTSSAGAVATANDTESFDWTFTLGDRQSYVTHKTVRLPTARTYRLSIGLPPIYRRRLEQRHRLSLLLKFTITRASGAHLNYTRRLTLSV